MASVSYLSDIFTYINELNLKCQGPDTTIFNAWNKIESLKNNLKLWLNMISEGNNECLSHTQIILWKQMICIHRIHFRYYCSSLEDIVLVV